MRNTIINILLILLSLQSVSAANLFIESESFDLKGGWSIDQQFMDQMGSPYLLAHGVGVPVEDASTTVEFPANGKYYVYVRTYNWTSPWSSAKGPGKFCVYVNGKKLKQVLGDSGSKWLWQSVGSIMINNTSATISLHDLTGFDGRCDALYFTTDPNDMPPSDLESLSVFRHKLLHLPDSAPLAGKFDLVVVGAGIAGMSAAVSAARLGCKVALINDRPLIGGNNSSEIRVDLGGRIELAPYKELGGLQKEFAPTVSGHFENKDNYQDSKKLEWIKNEKNISLFLNYHVSDVSVDNNKIKYVIAKNIETSEELRFEADLFADCTGDGSVGYLSGADYRIGREAQEEFGESIAPEKPDSMIMGPTIQWYSVENTKSTKFPEFEYGLSFNEENCIKGKKSNWKWEAGLFWDHIKEAEKIRDYELLVIYSNWSFLKNESVDKKEYDKSKLQWVGYLAGKRESRRLLGDYILSEDDISKNVYHEDGSFTTSWSIDLHRPDPKNLIDFPDGPFKSMTNHIKVYPCTVPYRCLYSRNINNLFMAGRDISVTHVALGTTRVMRTCGMMGEVVGMAASLCKKYGVLPRYVYFYHLPELKKLMTEGVNVKGLPNLQHYNEGSWLTEKPTVTINK